MPKEKDLDGEIMTPQAFSESFERMWKAVPPLHMSPLYYLRGPKVQKAGRFTIVEESDGDERC